MYGTYFLVLITLSFPPFFHCKRNEITHFKCQTTDQYLQDVSHEYGPLCDNTPDCDDESDENHCEEKQGKKSYTGCWNILRPHGSEDIIAEVTDCESCMCIADVDDCSLLRSSGTECPYCVKPLTAIGNGKEECVNGIDETPNAKEIQKLANSTGQFKLYKVIIKAGNWVCNDVLDGNQQKDCGLIIKKDRRPYLKSFHSAYQGKILSCNNLLGFKLCSTEEKCILESDDCEPSSGIVQPKCKPNYQLDRFGNCVPIIPNCSESEKKCRHRCITLNQACDGLCLGDQRLCEGHCIPVRDPCGPDNKCFGDLQFCASSLRCLDRNEPCPGRCFPLDTNFCPETGICISNDVPCGKICLAPGYSYCKSSALCHPPDRTCPKICPQAGQDFCPQINSCIPKDTPCGEICLDPSYRLCKHQNSCISEFFDYFCKSKTPDTSFGPTSTPITRKFEATTALFTSTSGLSKMRKGKQNDSITVEYDDKCDFRQEHACNGTCIKLKQPCNGTCNVNRILCDGICILNHRDDPLIDSSSNDEEVFTTCIENEGSSEKAGSHMMSYYVGLGVGLGLLGSAVFVFCLMLKKRRQEPKNSQKTSANRYNNTDNHLSFGPRSDNGAREDECVVEIVEANEYYEPNTNQTSRQHGTNLSTFGNDFETIPLGD